MATGKQRRWQFWIDRGGTFTDIVARRPDGTLITHKLLSDNPEQYEDAALEGIRRLTADLDASPEIQAVKMGTTVATNALLERKGENTALVVTKGFKDALRIGYQNRPSLFDRHIVLPELLYSEVVEADERVDARGEVSHPLEETSLRRDLDSVFNRGIRSVAIVLLHGYRFPVHERLAARIASEVGFTQISVSHEVIPLMKLISRGDTTVVDAYLSPMLQRYIQNIREQLSASFSQPRLMFMQSNGGLTSAELFRGKNSILSGPAGGVVGLARTGEMAGFRKLIGFDMGGTSTDVSLYNGEFEYTLDSVVAGVRLRAPMMKIHTVAAGGGSVLHFDAGRFQVGPDSAGANPGPACYRRKGPLTVTDTNLMLGRIWPEFFPAVFGRDGNAPLDDSVVRKAFHRLSEKVSEATGRVQEPEEVADGFLRVAVEKMANAIKHISIQRGLDPREYVLGCFGGAGGQHACLVADALEMNQILIHPLAGVLSAYGMGLADLRAMRQQSVELPFEESSCIQLQHTLDAQAEACIAELLAQNIEEHDIEIVRKVHMRYAGTDTSLAVSHSTLAAMSEEFDDLHRERFGFIMEGKARIMESAAVEAVGKTYRGSESTAQDIRETRNPAPLIRKRVRLNGRWQETGVFKREQLPAGTSLDGPALIIEDYGTTVVEPGWEARITEHNHLLMTRVATRVTQEAIGTRANPVMLEVFNNLFMNIAEQMGAILENTAYSVNIKERLDFSCALFDREGQLIANAPHMPVHLGSMGDSVRAVLQENQGTMVQGDVYLVNAPYNGGTHLPDITAVTPVFDEARKPLFVVASRAHHADIGGVTPGSMPPHSTDIHQEGVLFDNFKVVHGGMLRERELTEKLASGDYPARNPAQNIADINAQIAANEKGVREVRRMIEHFSLPVVQAYMQHVQDNAEESVRRVIAVLKDGEFCYPMDQGQEIRVRIIIDKTKRSARIDFTSTSAQSTNNFNAPVSVCRAAVLYVFRTLVDRDIPMNAGCLKPLEIIVPEGSMLNPRYPAAVVAGNVETSQCITDALYGALGVQAAAQGTMNNFTFGDDTYQYYETVCGGSGAGPDFDGTDAVQTHMTNSRLTDPEVLEWRFPVRVKEFSIRAGSGGAGLHRGGNGTVRKIEFAAPLTASILSNHRRVAPFGMAGGEPGAVGKNWIRRADGRIELLDSTALAHMEPGDVFVIETPGGGGYGSTSTPRQKAT